jgi:outer membrane protein TolC
MKMIKIISAALISAAVCFSYCAQAQEKIRLTLNQCRVMALDSNIQMKSAKLMEKKTKYDKSRALSYFLPKFSGYGLYYYTNDPFVYHFKGTNINVMGMDVPIPAMDISLNLSNTMTAGVKVEQPVFMGGKIIATYKMAGIGMEMALLNTQMNRSEIIVQIDEAYWLYVKACQLWEAANSFSTTVEEFYKVVKDASEIGMATKNDLLKVEVQRNNAKLLLSKAHNGKNLSKMNLCHYLGISLLSDLEVDQSDFDKIIPIDSLSGSITNRYDYKLLEKQTELKQKEVSLARADFLPQIGVAANYGYYYGLKINNDILLNQDSFSAMASVKIPIFAFGEGVHKIKAAELERDMKINEKERLADMMELEEAKYRFAFSDAKLEVELTKSALKNAEVCLKVSKDQYELGMETLANVLEAQTQWNKANSDYIEAVSKYKLSYTKYLKAIGEL